MQPELYAECEDKIISYRIVIGGKQTLMIFAQEKRKWRSTGGPAQDGEGHPGHQRAGDHV
jgi:hypothetical protein